MKGLKVFVVTLFILYYLDIFSFSGNPLIGTVMHYILLGVCVMSGIAFAVASRFARSSFPLWAYAIVFPLVAAMRSHMMFGQSYFLGFASLRYELYVLFAFFLLLINYPFKTMIRQINIINITVAAISIIAFYFFDIDSVSVQKLQDTGNVLDVSLNEDAFLVKGRYLNVCSRLMVYSLIYYLVQLLRRINIWNLLGFAFLLFYILFVHKGRQPILILAGVFVIYYFRMKNLTVKKMVYSLVPVIVLVVLYFVGSSYLHRFTEILGGENSGDFSTEIRTTSLMTVLPYIKKHFLLGVGNLSLRFHGSGFQAMFGEKFFIQDIGIFGSMFIGGLFLIGIYAWIFYTMKKNLYKIELEPKWMLYMVFLVDYFILQLFVLEDPLVLENAFAFAILYYPLFGFKRSRET